MSSTTTARGAGDLYVGAKVAFATAPGLVPALAIIPQMSVPTGSAAVTAGRVLPGMNVEASWDVVKERDSIEVIIANNRTVDGTERASLETATGITNAVHITRASRLLESGMRSPIGYPADRDTTSWPA